jgi:hypothetical protein
MYGTWTDSLLSLRVCAKQRTYVAANLINLSDGNLRISEKGNVEEDDHDNDDGNLVIIMIVLFNVTLFGDSQVSV